MSLFLSVLRRPQPITLRAISVLSRTMAHSTLSDEIKKDHQEIYQYYDKYVQSSGDTDAQERWSNQLRWEIARHSIGEELIVYPLMEAKLGPKGRELADQDRADHQKVKERLYRLESLTPGSQEHASLLKDIIDHLREHADSEETKDLPPLEATLGQEVSISEAQRFQRTKRFAPTRSHPSAPDKPPFETLAGLMAAPLDKLKDAFAKFPTKEMENEIKV